MAEKKQEIGDGNHECTRQDGAIAAKEFGAWSGTPHNAVGGVGKECQGQGAGRGVSIDTQTRSMPARNGAPSAVERRSARSSSSATRNQE